MIVTLTLGNAWGAILVDTGIRDEKSKRREAGDGFGAGDRIRTGDINLGKVALYQLSYSRMPFLVFSLPDSGAVKSGSGTIGLFPVSVTIQRGNRTPTSCF
jgi:hypothetical protein